VDKGVRARIRTWLIYLRFATQLISALPCLTIWSVMILGAHPNFNAYAAYDRFNPSLDRAGQGAALFHRRTVAVASDFGAFMKPFTSTARLLASFLVATTLVQACGENDDPLVPGTLTVTLTPNTGSAPIGGTASIPVTVTGNRFNGTPGVTVTGLPAGVTFSVGDIVRNGQTSTTTVTLNVASTAVAGVYPINVVATGQGVSAVGSTYTLTITGGTIGLAFTPATLSVAQGASVTSNLAITRTGFAGDLELTVTGAPTGVTATLSPTTATGNTSTLTVNAAPNAALGPATLTLTATSPVAGNQTVTIPITITAPSSTIGLTLTPATLSVPVNGNASTTIALARTNFTGDVTFTAENLPTGVTVTFTPNPSTGTGATTTLQLTASGTAVAGTSNITIRATGTGITAVTAPLALTITP
jgi:hypothetical protein